jgi:hypothetical protein
MAAVAVEGVVAMAGKYVLCYQARGIPSLFDVGALGVVLQAPQD